jgi:MraZ protein
VYESGRKWKMIFLGTYQHSVDIKNRISLPSKFFEKLSAEIYISKGFDGCLEIRNEKEFKEYVDGILSHSNTNANVRQVQRVFLSNTTKVEIDSSKRVLVPSYLLKEASITKDVTVIGVGDKIEL